jgi:hypothetical protein
MAALQINRVVGRRTEAGSSNHWEDDTRAGGKLLMGG